jgi:hypothetical protein
LISPNSQERASMAGYSHDLEEENVWYLNSHGPSRSTCPSNLKFKIGCSPSIPSYFMAKGPLYTILRCIKSIYLRCLCSILIPPTEQCESIVSSFCDLISKEQKGTITSMIITNLKWTGF